MFFFGVIHDALRLGSMWIGVFCLCFDQAMHVFVRVFLWQCFLLKKNVLVRLSQTTWSSMVKWHRITGVFCHLGLGILKHEVLGTLCLCQNRYWKWPLIVSCSIKSGDLFNSYDTYVKLPEGISCKIHLSSINPHWLPIPAPMLDHGPSQVMAQIGSDILRRWSPPFFPPRWSRFRYRSRISRRPPVWPFALRRGWSHWLRSKPRHPSDSSWLDIPEAVRHIHQKVPLWKSTKINQGNPGGGVYR